MLIGAPVRDLLYHGRRETPGSVATVRQAAAAARFEEHVPLQACPSDARRLCDKRHDGDIAMGAGHQATQPFSEMRGALGEGRQCGPRAVNRQHAQLFVAALGSAEKLQLPSCCSLSGDQSQPSGELATEPEGAAVVDRGYERGGVEHADARNCNEALECLIRADMFLEPAFSAAMCRSSCYYSSRISITRCACGR